MTFDHPSRIDGLMHPLAARLWSLPCSKALRAPMSRSRPEDAAFALRADVGFAGEAAPFALDAAGAPVHAPLDPAAMLAAYPAAVSRVRLVIGSAETFEQAVLPALFGWAALVQGLPARPSAAVCAPGGQGAGAFTEMGGLFHYGLLTAAAAAEMVEQRLFGAALPAQARRTLNGALRLAGFFAGLLAGVHTLERLEVEAGIAEGGRFREVERWRPGIEPLHAFALRSAMSTRERTLFRLSWRAPDGLERSGAALTALSILNSLMTADAKARLRAAPGVWSALAAAASGEPGDPSAPEGSAPMLADALSAAAMRAARAVVRARARETALRDAAGPLAVDAAAWGQTFEYALKVLIGRRTWTINEPPFFAQEEPAAGCSAAPDDPLAASVGQGAADASAGAEFDPSACSSQAFVSLAWGIDGLFLPWPAGISAAAAFLRDAFGFFDAPADPHAAAQILAGAGLVIPAPDGTPFWTVRLPRKAADVRAQVLPEKADTVTAQALRLADPMRWTALAAAAERIAGVYSAYASRNPKDKRASLRPMAFRLADGPAELPALAASQPLTNPLRGRRPMKLPEGDGDFPAAVAALKARMENDGASASAASELREASGETSSSTVHRSQRRRTAESFFAFSFTPASGGEGEAKRRLAAAMAAMSIGREAGSWVLPEGLFVPLSALQPGEADRFGRFWKQAGLAVLPKRLAQKLSALGRLQDAEIRRSMPAAARKSRKRRVESAVERVLTARTALVEVVEAQALESAFQAAAERVDRRNVKLDESLRMGDQTTAAELEDSLSKTLGFLVPRRLLDVRKCWENGDSRPCGWPACGRYAVFVPDGLMERLGRLNRAEAERRRQALLQETAGADIGTAPRLEPAAAEQAEASAFPDEEPPEDEVIEESSDDDLEGSIDAPWADEDAGLADAFEDFDGACSEVCGSEEA